MAEATPEAQATGSQIHPLLRQRMLNRAATFSEGAPPIPPIRRRSSLLSDYSDTRHSLLSSTDNLPRPNDNDTDMNPASRPSIWHSAPLVFAILPAIGGLLFQNGSAVVTDVLLLALASVFLHWCVMAPWYVTMHVVCLSLLSSVQNCQEQCVADGEFRDWYHAAQRSQYLPNDASWTDTIPEEDERSEGTLDDAHPDSAEVKDSDKTSLDKELPEPRPQNKLTAAQEAAQRELGREEVFALIGCFVSPLLGAYLLHTIRSQLTRPSEGLVSNFTLTICT
jgi:hypothetical protein